MSREEVKQGVFEVINESLASLDMPVINPEREDTTMDDTGLDSLDIVEVSVLIDERFEIYTDYEHFK